MKVLHINTERTWRGGEQQTLNLIRAVSAAGVESLLLCPPGSPLCRRAQAAGVAVRPVQMAGEADLAAAFRIRRIVRQGGFRLVHAHTSHAHTLAYLATVGLAVRRLVTRRVEYSIYRRSFFGLNGLKYRRMTDRIIAISARIREVLAADGLDPDRIALIPSGVDPERFAGERPEPVASEFGIRPAERVVLNVGHLVGIKGQRTLIEAAPAVIERVPEARFFILGEGPLRADLARRIAALGLEGRVHLTGFRADVGGFYRRADLLAAPSLSEGLGTAVLDALALGIPVVAAASGGLPEIVRDGVTGRLVPPADPAALAAALVELLTQPELCRRLGAAGRLMVQREYSITVMAERTLALYRELSSG